MTEEGRNRTERNRTERNRTERNRTERSKTEKNKTEKNKTEKSKTGNGAVKGIGDILVPFLVYFVVHDLASFLLAFMAGMGLSGLGEGWREFMAGNAASVNGVLNGLALCAGMAAVLLVAGKELQWREGNRADGDGRGTGRGTAVQRALGYLPLVLCAVSLSIGMNLLLTLTGLTQMSENYTEISGKQYGVAFVPGLVLYGVVSPVAEEIVFRGIIYNRMKRHFETGLSVLACGVLFGVYHGNLVQGIYGCVLGIAITLAYEWYGGMSAPVLFHGAANVCVFAVSHGAGLAGGMADPLHCAVFLAVAVLAGCFMRKNRCKPRNGQ